MVAKKIKKRFKKYVLEGRFASGNHATIKDGFLLFLEGTSDCYVIETLLNESVNIKLNDVEMIQLFALGGGITEGSKLKVIKTLSGLYNANLKGLAIICDADRDKEKSFDKAKVFCEGLSDVIGNSIPGKPYQFTGTNPKTGIFVMPGYHKKDKILGKLGCLEHMYLQDKEFPSFLSDDVMKFLKYINKKNNLKMDLKDLDKISNFHSKIISNVSLLTESKVQIVSDVGVAAREKIWELTGRKSLVGLKKFLQEMFE